ncbi:Cof-type HAD-IIB family hydrolase [Desulfofalx alkaliphila]|uniref:Cof-type HAD-IIB family hydrolase n=1 Tax=Desulfofalx alkaliphila TaxID=105483 RepID=UPI0004E1ED3D|nr:Cof-type HAD-IIB family hydrolase [Desulfofalx alkaliphila]
MSKYKLIAVDMDDTLLTSDLRLSQFSLETVRRVREKGIHITLATGRMFSSVKPYAKQLGINLPLITYQGALVKNALSGEVLLHRPVPLELAQGVIAALNKYGYHINLYVDDQLYVEEITPEARRYAEICGIEAKAVGDLRQFLQKAPTKILAVAPEEKIDLLMNEIAPQYGNLLHITKSKPFYLEFSHPQATKGEALAMLADLYGVKREEVMAVGDGYNDVEMLKYAGTAVVVGNARDEIKALADYVARSNDEDGVAHALQELVLAE